MLTEEMKAHLCTFLDDYDEKLRTMKNETQEYANSTCRLRKNRRNLREKVLAVKSNDFCMICFSPILQ